MKSRRRPAAMATVIVALVGMVAMLGFAAPASVAQRRDYQPNDPAYRQGLQWNLAMIGAPTAWAIGRGAGQTIAVIDSGVDLDHEDLAGKLVANVSCVGTGGDPSLCAGSGRDDDGHGTHVAGIAAADTNNGIGVAGVAPDAKLLAVRVLTDRCAGTDCGAEGDSSDVSAGVRWAVRHGATIVNLSLGSDATSLGGTGLGAALRYAWGKGVIPVIAAGNNNDQPLDFSDQPAVVVTAVNRQGKLASYANGIGKASWALAAPGGEPGDTASSCHTGSTPIGVLSTAWDPTLGSNQYACRAGTSMAAPHVAGALAILRGLGLSPAAAVHRILVTASRVPGSDGRSAGAGLLNLAKAVQLPPPAVTSSTSTTTEGSASAAQAHPPTPLGSGQSHAAKTDDDSPPSGPLVAAGVLLLVVVIAQVGARRRRPDRSPDSP